MRTSRERGKPGRRYSFYVIIIIVVITIATCKYYFLLHFCVTNLSSLLSFDFSFFFFFLQFSQPRIGHRFFRRAKPSCSPRFREEFCRGIVNSRLRCYRAKGFSQKFWYSFRSLFIDITRAFFDRSLFPFLSYFFLILFLLLFSFFCYCSQVSFTEEWKDTSVVGIRGRISRDVRFE